MIRNTIDFGKPVSGLMSLALVAGFLFVNSIEPPVLIDTFPDDEHVIEQTDTTIDRSSLRHPEKVDSVLSMMNLEEKVGQLNMLSSGFAETGPTLSGEYRELIGESKLGAILNAHTVDHTLDLQREGVEETRLGIPLILHLMSFMGIGPSFQAGLITSGSFPMYIITKKQAGPSIRTSVTLQNILMPRTPRSFRLDTD